MQVWTSPTDNGTWNAKNKRLSILIADRPLEQNDRIYTDDRFLENVMTHEALHGINEVWYKYMRPGALDAPEPLKSNIDDIRHDFKIALHLVFQQKLQPCNIDPEILNCLEITVSKMLEQSFRCIDEGHSEQQQFGLEEPVSVGHPYDGPSEVASSLMTIIDTNPSYIDDCFGSAHDPLTDSIRKLSKSVMEVSFNTTPQLESVLRKNPEASRAIDNIEANY
ncbi:MAG: hypothetical protein WAW80_03460 [Candidatus Saccharimonadales bacterium]